MPRRDVSRVPFPRCGAFHILVDIKHAHTPETAPKFPHQGYVDVDVLKPPSLWLPLPGGLSGLDFEGALEQLHRLGGGYVACSTVGVGRFGIVIDHRAPLFRRSSEMTKPRRVGRVTCATSDDHFVLNQTAPA